MKRFLFFFSFYPNLKAQRMVMETSTPMCVNTKLFPLMFLQKQMYQKFNSALEKYIFQSLKLFSQKYLHVCKKRIYLLERENLYSGWCFVFYTHIT
jgi:hypothetical protein